eukprot:CAMPEP_0114349766 /NCGR_PEP_ID=MMETSP0101-20121206/15804_1 /TAXON_ID=38822 ORGANISM="Pteridomonas danica, Strain PT" /NCGR_SAMPLE_ID=MMETSP0101 /ASSEMBLY_ACC=CAM_ASM_000211 /LENGTH=528 /DNA_ID=CAMNT_0001488555 /DNA_START=322 /DNA_END=1908 /DNA_ORIENTATION=-
MPVPRPQVKRQQETNVCTTSRCAVGGENEGAMAARKLANALSTPGVDSNLDCEKGIMRALTEYNYTSTDTPIELLREWTLVAIQRRDCGLLGRAMTLAAAGGHSMESLLENVGTLSTMLLELTGLFQQAVVVTENNSSTSNLKTSNERIITSPVACSVGSTDHPDLYLPECTSWFKESSERGKQLVLVKQVVNGKVSFFTNRAFDTYVVSSDTLQDSWAASGTPSIELFLHPEDAPTLCGFVGALWKNLRPNSLTTTTSSANNNINDHAGGGGRAANGDVSSTSGISERSCLREMTRPVRMWVRGQVEGYVYCTGRVQLVVTKGPGGQSSNVVFSFQPAQSHLLAADRRVQSYMSQSMSNSSSSSSSSFSGQNRRDIYQENDTVYQTPSSDTQVQVPLYVPPSSHDPNYQDRLFGINPAIANPPPSMSQPPFFPQPVYQQDYYNSNNNSPSENSNHLPKLSPRNTREQPETRNLENRQNQNQNSSSSFVRPTPPEVGDEILESSEFWDSVASMASELPYDDNKYFLEA